MNRSKPKVISCFSHLVQNNEDEAEVVYSSVVAIRKARVPKVIINRKNRVEEKSVACCFTTCLIWNVSLWLPNLQISFWFVFKLLVCLSNRLRMVVRMLYTAHWLSITTRFLFCFWLVIVVQLHFPCSLYTFFLPYHLYQHIYCVCSCLVYESKINYFFWLFCLAHQRDGSWTNLFLIL